MSLLCFGYLHRRHIIPFIAILTLTSTLFSVTAYSFLGFYNGFTNYVGEDNDVIAVYSTVSSTPFTGTVSLAFLERVNVVDGVVAVSAETIAPSIVNGHSVFIRGIVPPQLLALNPMVIVEGADLTLTDADSAIIGKNLAQRLNLQIGDAFLAFGVFSENFVQLEVKGIFESPSCLNDEALVPLYVGQWLRGVDYNHVSFIRAKIDPNKVTANQLFCDIANETKASDSPSPDPKGAVQRELEALLPLAQANLEIGKVGVKESQQFMKSYLDRYGVSRDTLIALSMIVLVCASGTVICALNLFVKQHSADLDTLKAIGVSTRKIKIDLVMRMLAWSLMSTLVGIVISAVVLVGFQQAGCLAVLSHTVSFQLDPLVGAANFGLLMLLMSVFIACRRFKW